MVEVERVVEVKDELVAVEVEVEVERPVPPGGGRPAPPAGGRDRGRAGVGQQQLVVEVDGRPVPVVDPVLAVVNLVADRTDARTSLGSLWDPPGGNRWNSAERRSA